MAALQKIVPFLWFDSEAEEAVRLYSSIFQDSSIGKITHYGSAGYEFHQMPEGTVMTVEFQLSGQDFIALNGGPQFKFTEAISFIVNCDNQKEIDYYWEKLGENGELAQCGWLKDCYGLCWQITPTNFNDIMAMAPDKVMNAMFQMQKIDIAALEKAAAS